MSLEGLNGVQSLYWDPSDFNWHLQSVATSSRGGWGWEQYAPLTLFLSQSWNGFGGGSMAVTLLNIFHLASPPQRADLSDMRVCL